MKYIFPFLVFICFSKATGQAIDSLLIKQVDSLVQISRTLASKREFDKALEINSEAEKIALERMGRESAVYGNTVFNRGKIYNSRKSYQEAEKWYLESLAIREKILGKEHPDYARSLSGLAVVYINMGKYEQAETLCLHAIAIVEKVLSKEDPLYTDYITNLAILYKYTSQYEKSESLYLESKAIREKVLGKKHADYAQLLSSLGSLYTIMGQYDKAEPLLLESIGLQENAAGKDNPGYCGLLVNLASLYRKMGNYEKTEQYLLEAKDIFERRLNNKEHPFYTTCLSELGTFYTDRAQYEKAEPYCMEVKAVFEKIYGKEHPNYAASLNNLARLYKYSGQYEKAESLYLESISIKEKALGREHPSCANSLHNLGGLYFTMGQYAKAEQFSVEACSVFKKLFGAKHPDYTTSLGHLVDLYEMQRRFSESNQMLAEIFSAHQDQLIKSVSFLSERELAGYASNISQAGNNFNSYLLARSLSEAGADRDSLSRICFDHSLFLKGFVLAAATKMNSLARSTPETREIHSLFKSYRLRLAAEYAKPLSEQRGVVELEELANAAEKKLAQSLVGYSDVSRQVNWERVRAALKPNEAVIEFIHFDLKFPRAKDSTVYAAIFMSSTELAPQFIPLFDEKYMDTLMQFKSERKADFVNSLYTLADRGAMAVEAPKKSLYEILWKPLESKVTGFKTIYYSPSGLLHRINLDAIPVSETETLADRHNMIMLNSARQLVIPAAVKYVNNDAVLYGGIQFDKDSVAQLGEPLMASRSEGDGTFHSMDSVLRGGKWNYLAGTEREVNSIENIMMAFGGVQARVIKGYEATEESFKRTLANDVPSPRILHMATHGYFFPDLRASSQQPAVSGQESNAFKASDHSMMRSGLIMAGGNAAWQGKPTLEGKDDGILTAYEISQMNLSNTELVVLSACETGLGEIQGNEGVYGLQRAFKIAGAKYLIMSLWQVPDKQTSILMSLFYKKWLELKMTIPQAFHAAQKELRDNGLDPYNWAGFVLVE